MTRWRDYHEHRDLPPNLYIRNNGYYCYRDPRTGKEFGLGRDRRIAITEAIQANIELFSGHKHKPLTARINSDNSVTLHSWLDRYEKILASRGIAAKKQTPPGLRLAGFYLSNSVGTFRTGLLRGRFRAKRSDANMSFGFQAVRGPEQSYP